MRLEEVVGNGYLFFLNADKTRSGMRSVPPCGSGWVLLASTDRVLSMSH
jgi:hypothetical protein